MPPPAPVTVPVVFTVATPVLLLVHAPPGVVLLKAVVVPWQIVTAVAGVIAAGPAFTVTMRVAAQPAIVYIMVAVPGALPVTTPPTTDAMPAAELLQAPPVEVVASVVVCPWHTDAVPVMAAGAVVTVIICALDV